jgi:hypothetical protein
VLLAAAIATTAGGCGGRSAAKSGSGPLGPKIATAYVNAQARALCLVQSKSYPTQAALRAAYVRAERSGNLSAHDFAEAQAATAQELSLRTRISDRVAATCGKHH